jgi:hypothetical protein
MTIRKSRKHTIRKNTSRKPSTRKPSSRKPRRGGSKYVDVVIYGSPFNHSKGKKTSNKYRTIIRKYETMDSGDSGDIYSNMMKNAMEIDEDLALGLYTKNKKELKGDELFPKPLYKKTIYIKEEEDVKE